MHALSRGVYSFLRVRFIHIQNKKGAHKHSIVSCVCERLYSIDPVFEIANA